MSKEVNEAIVRNFISQIYIKTENKYFNSLTLALNLARSVKDKKALAKLEYIKQNTTSKIGENLSIIEEFYNKNKHKSLNKTLNVFKKQFYLYEITRELSNAYDKMLQQVIIISNNLKLNINIDLNKYKI